MTKSQKARKKFEKISQDKLNVYLAVRVFIMK